MEDDTVTVRDRDTATQDRVAIADLENFLKRNCNNMKIIQKTFPNGLRLVMAPQAGCCYSDSISISGYRSKYENKKQNGLSHFLEHMYFKGTTLRPSAKIIAEAFDGLGAVNNAFTDKEYTGYYAKEILHTSGNLLKY